MIYCYLQLQSKQKKDIELGLQQTATKQTWKISQLQREKSYLQATNYSSITTTHTNNNMINNNCYNNATTKITFP